MNKSIYKSPEGKNILEGQYKQILNSHREPAFEQLFIHTPEAKTHILKFGDNSKPALVLLHGSTSNSASWLGNIEEFLAHFCVYCLDIPGEPGLSEGVRLPLTSDKPSEWLSSVLNELNIKKASFLGMSLGSWYILNFAAKHPQRVRAVSMITSSGLAEARKGFIFKAIFYMMLGKTGQKLLNKAIYHKCEVTQEVLDFQALMSKHFNPLIDPIPIFTDEQMKQLSMPMQYFGGDHDVLLDTQKTANRLKNFSPNSEIHILKDTGHVIIDQFSKVKEFLVENATEG